MRNAESEMTINHLSLLFFSQSMHFEHMIFLGSYNLQMMNMTFKNYLHQKNSAKQLHFIHTKNNNNNACIAKNFDYEIRTRTEEEG